MSLLRNFVTLGVAILAALSFTGCVGVLGSHADDPVNPNGITNPPTGTLTPPVKVTILAPLTSKISGDNAAKWVPVGSSINVSASPIQGATGDLQTAWFTGPLTGTAAVPVKANATSGYIEPGASTGLRFSVAGIFFMHCHPHPWMRSNVTVVDGWANPDTVEVDFVDGATPDQFHFVPENITIHPGTTVVYHNLGQQTHVAMQLQQDAPLKPLPIKGLSGAAQIQGVGWQRVVLLMRDSAGHYGQTEYAVFASAGDLAPFAPFHAYYNLTTARGAPDAIPSPAGGDSDTKAFKPDFNGTMFVNYTATTQAQGNVAPDPVGVPKVQIHVKEAGVDQDALTADSATSGNITGRTHNAIYSVIAKADQGAQIVTQVEVTVIYDLTPPAPSPFFDPESIPHTH